MVPIATEVLVRALAPDLVAKIVRGDVAEYGGLVGVVVNGVFIASVEPVTTRMSTEGAWPEEGDGKEEKVDQGGHQEARRVA